MNRSRQVIALAVVLPPPLAEVRRPLHTAVPIRAEIIVKAEVLLEVQETPSYPPSAEVYTVLLLLKLLLFSLMSSLLHVVSSACGYRIRNLRRNTVRRESGYPHSRQVTICCVPQGVLLSITPGREKKSKGNTQRFERGGLTPPRASQLRREAHYRVYACQAITTPPPHPTPQRRREAQYRVYTGQATEIPPPSPPSIYRAHR